MISLVELLTIVGLATLTAAGVSHGLTLLRQSRGARTVASASGSSPSTGRPDPGVWHTPRRNHRHRIHCPVEYFTQDGASKGMLLDMSKQGWRVAGPCPMKLGTTLSLHLCLPGQSTALTIDQAIVRWTSDNEFGIELMTLGQEAAARFSDYLTTQLPTDQQRPAYTVSPYSYN